MKRTLLTVLTALLVAGSWQAIAAQATKPAKTRKVTQPKTAEAPPAVVETAALPAPAADTAPVVDSTTPDTAHHKKHGLFGKAKGVLSNKVVQTVAKTAACTMVPGGGQLIAGAIDAAASKSAGEAASGAAGVATGSSCMPGMGAGMGGAGMAGAGMAGAGLGGGLAGLAATGVAGAAEARMSPGGGAYATGMGTPGGMPGFGMGDPTPMAQCMGLTVEEYNAMTNPTNSEPRSLTKDEMKRAQKLTKKVGSRRMMECNQQVGAQQQGAQMAQMQQAMAQAQGRMAGAGAGAGGYAPPNLPGVAQPAVPGESPGAAGGGSTPEQLAPVAACMGITVDEYMAMTLPTGGQARPATKAESKRAEKLTKKVGEERMTKCEAARAQTSQ